MKSLISVFLLVFTVSLFGQPAPVLRNSWSTNAPGTPVQGVNNLSVTNLGSGTNWQFYNVGPKTIARLSDVSNIVSSASGSATNAVSSIWTNTVPVAASGATNLNFVDGTNIIWIATNNSGQVSVQANTVGVATTANLNAASNVLRTDITNLQGATNGLNTRAGNLEGATNGLNTRVGNLEGATNGLDALVRTKQHGSAVLTNLVGTVANNVTNVVSLSTTNATSKPLTNAYANGALTLFGLEAGANITLTPNGSNIVIAGSAGSGTNTLFQTNGVNVGSAGTVNWTTGVTGFLAGAVFNAGVNVAGGSGGGLTTNANQFLGVPLSIKSGVQLTNVIVNSSNAQSQALTVVSAPGIGTNIFEILNTNGQPVIYALTNNGMTLVTSNLNTKGDATLGIVTINTLGQGSGFTSLDTLSANISSTLTIGPASESIITFVDGALNIDSAARVIGNIDAPTVNANFMFVSNTITVRTNLIVQGLTGGGTPQIKLLSTNGNSGITFSVPINAATTNHLVFDPSVFGVGQVLKVHSVSGQTVVITNDTDSSAGGGLTTNANQFLGAPLSIKSGVSLTNVLAFGSNAATPALSVVATPGFGTNSFQALNTNGEPIAWITTNNIFVASNVTVNEMFVAAGNMIDFSEPRGFIYEPGLNTIYVNYTGGSTTNSSMHVFTGGGNVGIRTNSPAQALHVRGDVLIDGNLRLPVGAVSNLVWTCTNSVTGEGEWRPLSPVLTNLVNNPYTGYTNNLNGSFRMNIQSVLFPTNNPPGLDTGTNFLWRLLFDDTTDETGYWQFELPADYSTNAELVCVYSTLAAAAATSNIFMASTHVLSMTALNNINVDSFSSVVSVTNRIPETAGWATNFVVNLGISAVAGDFVRLKLNRDANNSTDNATGDTALHGIAIRYTKK